MREPTRGRSERRRETFGAAACHCSGEDVCDPVARRDREKHRRAEKHADRHVVVEHARHNVHLKTGVAPALMGHTGLPRLGNGVNIAARLQTLAAPSSICVSEAVSRQVYKKLDLAFEDMGVQELKNIPSRRGVARPLPDGVDQLARCNRSIRSSMGG